MNKCKFSPCRQYRYSLIHQVDEIQIGSKFIMWIGLNPSTADENQLDPTLRRIRVFTRREDGHSFAMTNLFAWRDTQPKNMMAVPDPVGPENDEVLQTLAKISSLVICAWGADGYHRDRYWDVVKLLDGIPLFCLGTNGDGSPRHPLYVAANTPLVRFYPVPRP